MRSLVRILGFAAVVLPVLTLCASAIARVPPVLLEACNAVEPAHKRLQCLRAANDQNVAKPQPVATSRHVIRPNPPLCYIERGGGSYAITADGRKDYGGC